MCTARDIAKIEDLWLLLVSHFLVRNQKVLTSFGLKHKQPLPAKEHAAEKQFAETSDHWTLLLVDQMDQTDTIWCPTDTRHDTSAICHIGCTFAHTNGNIFQHTPSI